MESEEENITPDMSENSQSTSTTGAKKGSNSNDKDTQNRNFSGDAQGLEYRNNTGQERIPAESSEATLSDGVSPDILGSDGQDYTTDNAGRVIAQGFQVIQSGPIPPALEMMEYKKIDPDFPNRIMTMAEKQQDANIKNAHRYSLTDMIATLFTVALVSITPLVVLLYAIYKNTELGIWVGAVASIIVYGAQIINVIRGNKVKETQPNPSDSK